MNSQMRVLVFCQEWKDGITHTTARFENDPLSSLTIN